MKNKIIYLFFVSDERKDKCEDENNTNLLVHLSLSMILRIKLFN